MLRKKPPGQLLPSAHAVDREYKVMKALQDTDVPVPRVHLLCDDDSIIGTMFYVMDYVDGRVYTDRLLPGCTPQQRARDVRRHATMCSRNCIASTIAPSD